MGTEESISQHELKLAHDIQQSFLPEKLSQVPGTEIAALMRPAREVGGDFYDAFPLTGGRLGVLVGDVSGKSVPAALYMALARTLLRSHSLSAQPRYLTDALENAKVRRLMRSGSLGALAPLGAVRQANEYLMAYHSGTHMFFTLFYAVYEPQRQLLTFVNAGHNPPLLHIAENGEQEWLPPTDMAVGLMAGRPYEAGERQLSTGDVLVIYSDGVTEAMDAQFEQFGTERLAQIVTDLAGRSAQDILDGVANGVARHAADVPQSDDLTLLVLKVTE